ncbi:MAG: CarD family transcriptional regulator [Bacillota bacterium]|nr:CarD family transcriptional regulator [Bacillota bacterium]
MSQNEFIIGELVSYGTNGLCTIENIEMMSMVSDEPEMPYYVLKPESSSLSTVYVPMHNEKLVSRMRKLLTPEEIKQMVSDTVTEQIKWNNDRRYRNDSFHNILNNGVSKDMLLMIQCIEKRKEDLTVEGKKLPTTDTTTLKQAERLVSEEFSKVLGIDKDQIEDYVLSIIESIE